MIVHFQTTHCEPQIVHTLRTLLIHKFSIIIANIIGQQNEHNILFPFFNYMYNKLFSTSVASFNIKTAYKKVKWVHHRCVLAVKHEI